MRAFGILATVSNNIKEIWRPVDMILLQASDNNTDSVLSLSHSHTARVHCDRNYNNTASVTEKKNETAFLD